MAGRALNDDEVSAEMKKMTEFIRQEAQEKAREIQVKADEEHNIEKAKLVRQETIAIDAQFQKKVKQAEVQQRIALSNHINKSRLRVLQTHEELLQQLFSDSRSRLRVLFSDSSKYQSLLNGLMLQGLFKLVEREVVVRGRKQDLSLLESAIKSSVPIFKGKFGYEVKVTIDRDQFLPDPSAGGLILSANNGRIQVKNTLEDRLDLAADAMLPAIRMLSYGPSPNRRFFD